ncbi:MAG TPA: hypothetical protein VNT79_06830, partial [Phycisphaerae bacterium]|nr:hypothetical protein [Phycisphaerae bacterium]
LDKAKQYREANKDKFAELAQEKAKIGRDVPVAERMNKIRDIDRRKKELEKPLHALFVDMTKRLETLPSSKQRADIADADKKALEGLYRRLAGEVVKRNLVERPAEKPVESADGEKPKPEGDTVISTQPAKTPIATPQTQPVTP